MENKMRNITFYKMGIKRYENAEDKNSGLYEYHLIENELRKIDLQVPNGTLIVLNGAASEEEKDIVEAMINACHILGAKAIYIVTDEIAFSDVDFLNEFDVVMHQAWLYDYNFIKVQQTYSFVPELFYTGQDQEYDREYNNLILFCGNDTGREDKIQEYVRGKRGSRKNIFSLIKTKDNDERIPHDIYLRLHKMFKYSLMICRESYRKSGWITARLLESIDAGTLPIFDSDYDTNTAYRLQGLTITNKCDLDKMVKYYNKNDELRIQALNILRDRAEYRKPMFLKTMLKVCKEQTDDKL